MLSNKKRPTINTHVIPSKTTLHQNGCYPIKTNPTIKIITPNPTLCSHGPTFIATFKICSPTCFPEHCRTFSEVYGIVFSVHHVYFSSNRVAKLESMLGWKQSSNTTRAARLISGTGPRDSRNPVFKELGWLSLENRRCMHKCTMIFKCRNGLALPYLIDSFNVNTFNHSYSTRNSSNSEYP